MLVADVHAQAQGRGADSVDQADQQVRRLLDVVLEDDLDPGVGPALDLALPEGDVPSEPLLVEVEELHLHGVAAVQDDPAGAELQRNVEQHVQAALNGRADEVIEVRELHAEERAVDGERPREPRAELLVQPDPRLPLLLGPDAGQAVASELDAGAEAGYLG
ncbi:MAG: hypothetical protein DIU80_013420 [Chloroflexota bacterium]